MIRRLIGIRMIVLLALVVQLLSVKSYVPQLIRMLNRACVYITKHQSTMNPYLTVAQQNALQAVVSACAAFYGTNISEQP